MSSSSKPVIFVIGGPGCGKGTQCDLIVKKYGFTHLSTGDLLREEVASGSEQGKRLNEIMQSGKLVSLDEMLSLLKKAIETKSASSKGFLIDGYPREVEQAIRFENEVAKCSLILYFEVCDKTLISRLVERGKTSGRVDDNEETIKKRLGTFHQHSDPILKHYGERVKRICGERQVDVIFQEVCRHIDSNVKL